MSKYTFNSFLADEFESYLKHREASGYKRNTSLPINLKRFDTFIVENCMGDTFTKENANKWLMRREDETPIAHYRRINDTKNFFLFIFPRGYEIFLFDDVKSPPRDFVPHIYTKDEIRRYFKAVDSYTSKKNRYNSIQIPILFRLLYCCGTRIDETLMIRKKDVDLEAGVIRLSETKNEKERYIVLSDELLSLMKSFAAKTFYLLLDDEYIFRNYKGGHLHKDSAYEIHRKILQMAGIPYLGDGHGPRIHDWRFTFAVHSFKYMSDKGIDMYVALPILSTYMGHGSIAATEYYLKMTQDLFPSITEKMAKTADAVFGEVGDVSSF